MNSTTEYDHPDILDRLTAYTNGLEDGELKEFNQDLIGEISSLRMALQIFSDEFDNIQNQESLFEQQQRN